MDGSNYGQKKEKHMKKDRNKDGTQITNLCRKNGNNYGTRMNKIWRKDGNNYEQKNEKLWKQMEQLWNTHE
jgi:polygalacturonase